MLAQTCCTAATSRGVERAASAALLGFVLLCGSACTALSHSAESGMEAEGEAAPPQALVVGPRDGGEPPSSPTPATAKGADSGAVWASTVAPGARNVEPDVDADADVADTTLPSDAGSPQPEPLPPQCDGVLAFADPGIEYAVRKDASVPDTGDLTVADVAGVMSLFAQGYGIQQLDGVECLPNLQVIYLLDNKVSDLRPLSGMKQLISVAVGRNSVTDLTPLRELSQLRSFLASSNRITDLSPLAGLTGLMVLELDNNRVADLSPLQGLAELESLLLTRNRVVDISPLAGLTALTRLVLNDNSIQDASALTGLTRLQRLSIAGNQISDMGFVSSLLSLKYLTLGPNPVTDLAPIASLTSLVSLQARWLNLESIDFLAGLDDLEVLYLSDNAIVDLAPLANKKQLRHLEMRTNSVADLQPLVGNSGLGSDDSLDLVDNPLSDCSQVQALAARGVNITSNCP